MLSVVFTLPGTLTAVALSALLWLPFGLRRPRAPGRVWAALPAAALLFLPAVLGPQVALQSLLSRALIRAIPPFTLEAWPVLLAAPLALVAGAVQEAVRLLAVWLGVRLGPGGRSAAPAAGAFAGAGVALAETAWLLGAVPAGRLSLVSLVVLERVSADAFHVGTGVLLGRGMARRRTLWAWLLAVVLHTAVDTGAALYQMHRVAYAPVLAAAGVIGGGLYLALALPWRSPGRGAGHGADGTAARVAPAPDGTAR